MSIYDIIDHELKKMGKTRKDMCNETGISYNTLASLYRRRSENMSLETLRTISKYLCKSMEYILTGKSDTVSIRSSVNPEAYEADIGLVESVDIIQSRPEVKELCVLCKGATKQEVTQIINLIKIFKNTGEKYEM